MPSMTQKILSLLEVIVAALCLFSLTNATEVIVRAKKGGTAVLMCSLPAPDQGSAAPQHVIEWVRQDYDIAILIQFGVHDPRVHPNYDGRVSLIEGTSLQVRGLRLEDEGLYECRILPLDKTTDETESSGSWTLLSVTAPPMFTETPTPVMEVFVGRSLTLRCVARGNPRPIITWTKDGAPIKPQNKLKFMNGSLTFHAVRRETSGQYQCQAFNKEGNVTHITKLRVIGPPVIIIPPTDTVLNMSQDAKLKCQAEADPPNMTYVWQREGEDIYHIESLKSRIKVIVDGTLLISCLTPGDSGNYTCTPTNGLPVSPSASAVLTVQYPAQVIQMPKLTFLPTDMKGIISCPVRAEPPLSRVDWIKDGNPLDLDIYPGWTLTSEGSIIITTANDDAAGVYTCTPYNIFGTMGQSEPTTVILKDPPSFKMSPRKEYRQEVGRMLVIPCQMNGNPSPKVNWKKFGAASHSLFTRAVNGSLILHPLNKDHQGEWECSSTNQVATVSARTTVLVLGTSPHAVSSVSVIPGMNQANVSWEAGFDGGYTQKFTVWFKQTSAVKTDEKQEWLSFPILSTENNLLVTNLLPATEYQFSVMAQNKVGTGPFSEIITITTLDALPVVSKLEPPTGLSINQSSEGILLSWSLPQSKSPPIDSFVVQSRLEGQEWLNLKEHISPTKNQFFHGGLCKDCKYELRLLSRHGDELSIPSPSISVSTIGMGMPPASPHLLEFPDQLIAGVMGGVILLCLTLILAMAIVCFVFHRRGQRRRQNIKDLPPAINKNPPVKSDLSSFDNTLKQQLLPDHPLSNTSSSSDHSSLDKSIRSDFQGQQQHLLPQANPPSHHSLNESHLQWASLAPMNSVEYINRGPDGCFAVQTCEDIDVTSSKIKRNLSQNSHHSSDGNRSFAIQKTQSLRSYRDERKPPFVLSVDLPLYGSDIPSSSRTRVMAKHLSLNGHYMPIHEQEFLNGQDQKSICSDSSGSFLYPDSEMTLGRQSQKRGNSHSTASTLVLQMEHEREQGNLSRCLTLAREREELERELRKYTFEQNPSMHGKISDIYGEMYPTRETSTPQSNYQAMRQSLLLENTTILKGRAASCIPWEARHRISSASLVPLHTSYGKDNKYSLNPHGYHTVQRPNQRSRSLDRGELQKSHTWDHRSCRTPVDSNLARVIGGASIYKVEKTHVGVGHSQKRIGRSQQHFDTYTHSSSDNQQGRTIDRSTRQMNQPGDYSEISADGPDLESLRSPYSRSIMGSNQSYETLDYDRQRLSELEQNRSLEQKLESGIAVSRRNQEMLSRTGSPRDVYGKMLHKTKSLGSNTWNRDKSTQSLYSKTNKEQFLPPDVWIDSLTLGRDSTMSPFASRPNSGAEKTKSSPNLKADSLVPSESKLQNLNSHASKASGGSTNNSESRKNLASGHHAHTTLSPGGSSWPLSYCPSLSAIPSGSQSQSQDDERDEQDEDVQEVDVEINQYRKNSETEGSYRSYASQSSGRGSMDAPTSRQFSLSPSLTSSPETTQDSDRDEATLQEHELQERPRRAFVDESYEWNSAYVPMHPVGPKASISNSGLHRELINQGKQSRTTKHDYRPDLDLKPKAPAALFPHCEQESLLSLEIQKSSIALPNPEPDTVLF
ncbi:protein turtle homolog A-like [Xyrauchen texanus]|uniref:protein turtle homolog A-like n=1 Tax=Xyrauchen texanus TaxID=154827 RepID=UPI002242469A|nr:protein turtle homolog A-like [Xyrauchen texanus]XP_051973480.1 protein turtle homolog A-like [Xyrauchen texanus]XP_051973481.1 protein turtle homolog A-like [Xyrauchen texanus]